MVNISNYKAEKATPVSYAKISNNTERIIKFVEYLHEFLPCLEQEFNDLQELQEKYPNDKFPTKMENLAAIYQAEKPLYDLYVTKAPNRQ
jgi:hypothetical protein